MQQQSPRHAFSLVELSIVLVIVGLLVGGILAGKSLIKAAELRSVSHDINKYLVAQNTFKDKYFAIPGDMTNATSFWTSAGGNGSNAACYAVSSTDAVTCNGNGDLVVYLGPSASYREYWNYWKHMALAGLIEGTFTGANGTSGVSHAMPGGNVPAVKYKNGSINITRGAPFISGQILQAYYVGISTTTGTDPLFTPEEVWNIDTKMDDGMPGIGRIYVRNATTAPGCATSDDPATAEYDLDNDAITCTLYVFLRRVS